MKGLRQLLRHFEKRAYRERLLILATACVLSLVLGLLLVDPLAGMADRESSRLRSLRTEISDTQQRMQAIQQELHAGGVIELRDEKQRLQAGLQQLDAELAAAAGQLISPRRMVEVLESVLLQGEGLELLELENQAVVSLFEEQDETAADYRLYRHGFVLRFRGSFFPVLRYLAALEQESWPFFWDSLRYHVEEYPDAIVELQVHTLSDSPEWVGV